mmetsp:Transcript_12215/g.34935  ORF Transcript_12215/g.34935 Transcript_12215/m.34935 type:complete len:91 (-) Transcript_12215:5-277(-)
MPSSIWPTRSCNGPHKTNPSTNHQQRANQVTNQVTNQQFNEPFDQHCWWVRVGAARGRPGFERNHTMNSKTCKNRETTTTTTISDWIGLE